MIRKMLAEDASEVARIEQEVFGTGWSEKSFLDALHRDDTIYLVEEDEYRIKGYCGIWISYESADLCNIVVLEKYRKQGIGETLLTEAMCQAERNGVERIMLEVRESNISAIHLYEKLRFRHIYRRKAYYSNPKEDAIIMEYRVENIRQ